MMFILETKTGILPHLEECWQMLAQHIPQAISFYSAINNGPADVIRYEQIFHIAGKPFIEEKIGSFTFHIYPQSFFQPNAKAAEALYQNIGELAGLNKHETILGLYCGTGPIEISLSPFVKQTSGIDSLSENITNAIENCRINGITNCSFHAGKVEDLLKNRSFHMPDILILDPPRGGMSKNALKVILKLHPPKIVYISCNPSTLARDLKHFQENRYTIEKIAPFDFFPHTSHLETLVYLQHHS
jgi:23S rRNA (uracil1939-C5)-methyltransferase